MKRTLILFAIFVVLAGVTAWLLLGSKNDKSSILYQERDFAVRNTDEIYKIFIADRQGGSTTLDRDGEHWIYNGKYRANPNVMENLLDAISRIEMKYKPADAAVGPMVQNLATEGLKVELYDRSNKLIKAYYVGGSTPDERGTFMMIEEAEQPYVVSIPSWEGNVRFRYSIQGDDWRDKTIFAAEVEEIEGVTLEYPRQKNKSFRLERKGETYTIEPYYGITSKIEQPPRAGAVEQYLVNFERLIAESLIADGVEQDKFITGQIPFCIITLKQKGEEDKVLEMYPRFKAGMYDQATGALKPGSKVERYDAILNQRDHFLVQDVVFGKILWAYESFFQE